MTLLKKKPFLFAGAVLLILFMSLFIVRLGLFDKTKRLEDISEKAAAAGEHDNWMNIFQGGKKIGYSHSTLMKKETGHFFRDTVFMRINTLGMLQDIHMKTEGELRPDFTLQKIDFSISSGLFKFSAEGKVVDNILSLKTESGKSVRLVDIPLENTPYLISAVPNALASRELKKGDRLVYPIFDPSTMGQETVEVEIMGKEDIENMGEMKSTTRVAIHFKGSTQMAWISPNGEIIKEIGLLGIVMEKTTLQDALYNLPIQGSKDLTEVASIPSNIRINNPFNLERAKIRIGGIDFDHIKLDGGRQKLEDGVLTIQKESLTDLASSLDTESLDEDIRKYLKPSPFIESDNEEIITLVNEIVSESDPIFEKTRKIMGWIYKNIEKRPVVALPDAMATLENRSGDCNEHAVLFAAMLRAAGIPVKVEAGLVHLRGRFYYHAWNNIYLGKWITADSLFGQIPADVTHIRFTSGAQQEQLDLMGVIGKVNINVIEPSFTQ